MYVLKAEMLFIIELVWGIVKNAFYFWIGLGYRKKNNEITKDLQLEISYA